MRLLHFYFIWNFYFLNYELIEFSGIMLINISNVVCNLLITTTSKYNLIKIDIVVWNNFGLDYLHILKVRYGPVCHLLNISI